MKVRIAMALACLLLLTAAGCTAKQEQKTEGDSVRNGYMNISQQQAKEMMAREDDHLIVDVRRQDEYEAGHIPGAVCIPNESIGDTPPAELPDLDQILLIYCRSGNRSKKASLKLYNLGYTNIYEFGGILDWTGDVVTGPNPWGDGTAAEPAQAGMAQLVFDSFDGGGPEYTLLPEDETLLTITSERRYSGSDHEETDGAGYEVVYTLAGRQPGQTRLTVQARSPIGDNYDLLYLITVDKTLAVTLEQLEQTDNPHAGQLPQLAVQVGDSVLYAALEDNDAVRALIENMGEDLLSLNLDDYGGFEKVGTLPWELPRCDERITTQPGDITLYLGENLSFYYDENTWSLTRIGRLEGMTKESLPELFSDGPVQVTLWLEWTAE